MLQKFFRRFKPKDKSEISSFEEKLPTFKPKDKADVPSPEEKLPTFKLKDKADAPSPEEKSPEKRTNHGQVIERYPVNEPYAYISIEGQSIPMYRICEVELSKGEEELLKEIKSQLYGAIDTDFRYLNNVEEYLREKVEGILRMFLISVSPESMNKIMYYVIRDLVGYGRLDPMLMDKRIEDISADGPGIPVYVFHRDYGSLETNVVFDRDELDSLIYKLSQRGGRHISLARPLADVSLPTQDRLQLTLGGEITTKGSTFTIRKFKGIPFTPIDFIDLGTFSPEMAVYFWMAVENGFNMLIVGGTASGKTTALNAIAMFIPPTCKIVSIEDTREINILHQNWIPSLTRETEGEHRIEMYDLLRTALRQRPEYLIVGEVRGKEAYTLFQAMAAGHVTFATLHADSVDALVRRLTKPPLNVPLMLLDSLDIVLVHKMVKVGYKMARRCVQVAEVIDIDFDKEALIINEVFSWRPDEFIFSGESKVFHRIMDKLNLSEDELVEEFLRRLRIIKALREKGIKDFQTLSTIFFRYGMEPEVVEKELVR